MVTSLAVMLFRPRLSECNLLKKKVDIIDCFRGRHRVRRNFAWFCQKTPENTDRCYFDISKLEKKANICLFLQFRGDFDIRQEAHHRSPPFSRNVWGALWEQFRLSDLKCSSRCVSLKKCPLKAVLISEDFSRASTRTICPKWGPRKSHGKAAEKPRKKPLKRKTPKHCFSKHTRATKKATKKPQGHMPSSKGSSTTGRSSLSDKGLLLTATGLYGNVGSPCLPPAQSSMAIHCRDPHKPRPGRRNPPRLGRTPNQQGWISCPPRPGLKRTLFPLSCPPQGWQHGWASSSAGVVV